MTNSDTAEQIAKHLLDIKAIQLQPSSPFQWASGWLSPIYCDNRKILSYPKIRNFIRDAMTASVKQHYTHTEVIAGVATGGIAIGALVAQELELPFVYVRSSSKGHGLQNQVEGVLTKGQKVTVIEDLISTGNSSLKAVAALRESGADVLGMTSIFTYGFQTAADNFAENQCELDALCNYDVLIREAAQLKYISSADVDLIKNWKSSPHTWGKN